MEINWISIELVILVEQAVLGVLIGAVAWKVVKLNMEVEAIARRQVQNLDVIAEALNAHAGLIANLQQLKNPTPQPVKTGTVLKRKYTKRNK